MADPRHYSGSVEEQRSRVLAVDDDPNTLRAYRGLFATQQSFDLVGEVRDGAQVEARYEALLPDVVLMDLQMPFNGVDATRAVCARWADARVVAMTTLTSHHWVVAALRAGAAGYLVKGLTSGQFFAGLRQALAGEMPLSGSVRHQLVHALVADEPVRENPLTPRENELVNWLARGLTNRQIAMRMNVCESSVKQYFARAGAKLHATSRTQILVRAIQCGAVDPMLIQNHR